jgi:hypothetical protein
LVRMILHDNVIARSVFRDEAISICRGIASGRTP